jgi:hypothetical protein
VWPGNRRCRRSLRLPGLSDYSGGLTRPLPLCCGIALSPGILLGEPILEDGLEVLPPEQTAEQLGDKGIHTPEICGLHLEWRLVLVHDAPFC